MGLAATPLSASGYLSHTSPDVLNRSKRVASADRRSSLSGHSLTTLRAQPTLSPELARYPRLIKQGQRESIGQMACFVAVAVVVAAAATLPFIYP